MHLIKSLTYVVCAALFIPVLQGCLDHTEEVKKDRFVYCGQGSPDYFNPQMADNDVAAQALAPQLYESLIALDKVTMEPMARLATAWEMSEDGREYTFELRDNVEFHSAFGFAPTRPMNADDVVFTFERIIDAAHQFHQVNGSHYPWFSAINFGSTVKEVTALSPTTVRFRLFEPDNTFLSNLTTIYAAIQSKEYATFLEESQQMARIDTHPIGTGPFVLKEVKRKDYIRLSRHQNYWQGEPSMSQVIFDISSRGAGSLAKLLNGQCDVLYSPQMSLVPTITSHPDVSLTQVPQLNLSYIALKTSKPELASAEVRKALSLAIDRQSLINSIYFGHGEAAHSLLPSQSWAAYRDTTSVRFDPNYAKGLLAEAGIPLPLKLTMWVPAAEHSSHPSPRKVAELIQTNFAEIGVNLRVIFEDRTQRDQIHSERDYDMVLGGWNADTPDPDNVFRPLLSCDATQAGLNQSRWCHSDFDFLLDLAKETTATRYRKNLYHQAQVLVNDEVPLIPLVHGVQFQAKHHSIKGLEVSPYHTLSFEKVYREY